MEPVKHGVILNVRKYLKEHLPGYEAVEVRKKSWHEFWKGGWGRWKKEILSQVRS